MFFFFFFNMCKQDVELSALGAVMRDFFVGEVEIPKMICLEYQI